MTKKLLAAVLILLLSNITGMIPVMAQQNKQTEKELAQRKQQIRRCYDQRFKTGITLGDGRKLKGYVTQINEDTFEFRGKDNSFRENIAYSDVKKAYVIPPLVYIIRDVFLVGILIVFIVRTVNRKNK